ncbi:helix-turn-helix domain-containing protein [Herbiconiux sp. CPCC 203407]|uniref:Helix-turn-helix domain-containing protein n=1 Tax=Herbiconiux oxytropis TaxID=2970915 RepID=A0AA41XE29_9MICO|nr:helix-turn-helix domain-containing protein [Herbiconiux oxytropis]MCS5722534.1 helix-turn-helix domain-containing protein [Herbiconiux oxytropis]MCS5726474.1 helix-turn-helix domain-containing protein [Herbiconiux oxytropis]
MVIQELSEAEADAIFRALADSTRRDILRRAIRHERSISSLADRYAMSWAAVQKHVAVLERAFLIVKERRGKEQIVRANLDSVRRASLLLDQFEQLWHERLDRIGDILTPPDTASPDRAPPGTASPDKEGTER